jgi:hypothetical protein
MPCIGRRLPNGFGVGIAFVSDHTGGRARAIPPGARHQGVDRGEAIAIAVALSQKGAIDRNRIGEKRLRTNTTAVTTTGSGVLASDEARKAPAQYPKHETRRLADELRSLPISLTRCLVPDDGSIVLAGRGSRAGGDAAASSPVYQLEKRNRGASETDAEVQAGPEDALVEIRLAELVVVRRLGAHRDAFNQIDIEADLGSRHEPVLHA